MADRATLTKSTAPGGIATAGVTVTMTAANATNKEQFVSTGKELVLAWNTDAVNPYTVTINSQACEHGRTGDITAVSLAAGVWRVFGPFPVHGWRASTGYVTLEASNAAIKFGVITLP
jgi:hypothetical protein